MEPLGTEKLEAMNVSSILLTLYNMNGPAMKATRRLRISVHKSRWRLAVALQLKNIPRAIWTDLTPEMAVSANY